MQRAQVRLTSAKYKVKRKSTAHSVTNVRDLARNLARFNALSARQAHCLEYATVVHLVFRPALGDARADALLAEVYAALAAAIEDPGA
jgi:hypothetical protein